MKIRATTHCVIPQLGLSFERGDVREVGNEQGESLVMTGNFVKVEESETGERDGGYKHREMRRGRKNL
jgi:hypothetical protein